MLGNDKNYLGCKSCTNEHELPLSVMSDLPFKLKVCIGLIFQSMGLTFLISLDV